MSDAFATFQPGLEAPANRAVSVTPSNSEDLPFVSRALAVEVGGLVHVDTAGGDQNVAIPIAAGLPFPIRATRVYATGTTATGIVALA